MPRFEFHYLTQEARSAEQDQLHVSPLGPFEKVRRQLRQEMRDEEEDAELPDTQRAEFPARPCDIYFKQSKFEVAPNWNCQNQ